MNTHLSFISGNFNFSQKFINFRKVRKGSIRGVITMPIHKLRALQKTLNALGEVTVLIDNLNVDIVCATLSTTRQEVLP